MDIFVHILSGRLLMAILTQLCGISVFLVLIFFYKNQRKLHLESQNAFIRLWAMGFVSLLLDTFSVIVMGGDEHIPAVVAAFICKAYLVSIMWTHVLGLMYMDVNISAKKAYQKTENTIYLIYGVIATIIVMYLPIYLKVEKGVGYYSYGPSTFLTYIFSFLLLMRMLILLVKKRRQMIKRSWEGILMWVLLWIVAATIQFFNNELLIVSFASSIAILFIYLRLENPERHIDSETGYFNLTAFYLYMQQITEMHKSVSVLHIDYGQVGTENVVVDREVRLEVINFFDKIKMAYLFRNTKGIILTMEKREDVENVLNIIRNRFEKPWGQYQDVLLETKIIYLEDTLTLKRAKDVKRLISFVQHEKKVYEEDDFIVIDKELIEAAYKEENIDQLIQEALEQKRIEVFYQPIYSTRSKTFESAEALVRIRKENGDLIMPGTFIEIAEKRGTILEIGAQVFERVCQFIHEHNMKELGLHYIEVNLSVVQCGYKNLADDLIEMMETYQVDPSYINLEITESASLQNDKIFLENIYKLRKYGIRFSLDDFGTGQSNLNYIVSMPVDIVKFDRGMIQAYFENAKAKYVMDAAMMMIQGMNLPIVSEGIESQEQLEVMEKLGIQYIQGYYFSKPLSQINFVEFITTAKNNNKIVEK